MNLNAFKNISTQRTDRSIHSVRINPEHINHVVPSLEDRVGKSVLTMTSGLAGGSVFWPTDDVATLSRTFDNLTSVRVFNVASGNAEGSGLVNMARVVLIEDKGAYATLSFVDGTDLKIVKAWS